jgi:hypothetical protein
MGREMPVAKVGPPASLERQFVVVLVKLLPLAPSSCTATKSNKDKRDHQSHDPSTKHFMKGRGSERDPRIKVQNTSVPKYAPNRPWTARNFNVSVCT